MNSGPSLAEVIARSQARSDTDPSWRADYRQVHKADPADPEAGMTSCLTCKELVRPVPGGHGRTWVHDATGCVAGPGAP